MTPPSPRVVIDPGSHHLLNLGDVAMLQVCMARLRELWPAARIDVLTAAPDRLAEHCPDATPLPARGRYALIDERRSTWWRRGAARRRDVAVAAYVDGLEAADLFLLSGRGGLTDAFPGEADATLGELALATRMGKRIALLGQGIGPLTRRDLRRRAAAILPAVDLIALREDAAGPALLADLGVSPERIAITGDDAIALVDTPGESDARSIAVNIRVAQYAGVAPDAVAELSRAVRGVAEQLGAPVVPVALSTHPHEDDAAALAAGGFGGEPPRTPAQVIDRIGGARVMVTGSYHGAVFALSRGIPAVAISASPYYEGKFRGLRAMFGEGCEVVSLSGPEPAREVGIVARRLYESGPAPRAGLLAAAASQVEASRAAYARLAALAAQRAA